MTDQDIMNEPPDQLTAREREVFRQLAQRDGLLPTPAIKHPEPHPLSEAERQLFVPLWPVKYDGPPRSYEELAFRTFEEGRLWEAEKQRFTAMLSLGVQKKTQYACDVTYADPDEPLWRVSCIPLLRGKDNAPLENNLFPLAIRAPNRWVAVERWCEKQGLTGGIKGISQEAYELRAVPYVPPASDNGASNGHAEAETP
jgi:hypothetical protein